jgi:hypothetical protein
MSEERLERLETQISALQPQTGCQYPEAGYDGNEAECRCTQNRLAIPDFNKLSIW